MPIAYLTTPGLRVSLTSQRLEITVRGAADDGAFPERRWIPLVDIEHVVVDAGVSLSTHSLCGLMRRGIPVLFLSHGNFPHGLAAPLCRSPLALSNQLDAVRDAGFQLAQARLLVAAKIRNQRRVLQRLASERGGMAAGALSWLKNMVRQCEDCASIESLRGIEGAAAGRYFEAIGPFFPPQTPFKGRNKRPPRDPANALLSFIYTILTAELALHARAHGLEAGWGCYHAMEDGRPSLALDLVEPFRAPIADALALDLLNHGRLGPDDFETTPDGACLLRRASRRRLFAALEERLERQFSHRQSDERTTLRQIFKQQARAFRLACRQREPFSPFLMN